ncbi:MAG: LytTR family DNA-binding domain-containing protein [Bacteroides sp.]|nr:LytTR family DNA-binding domain-containing protein [Eubacterium sp.]MCM1419196.1 LytTR family DNA-binding domain-containing protein [Roseburia sp.]MCM1463037.1 LytTR family DNA-binding domain-containing protein [Bacteroides sp.]
MIKIAVCEDDPDDLERLKPSLDRVRRLFGELTVTEYKSAEELLRDVEDERRTFDLYLLDIYLGGINGIDAARRIRAENENALLIFISSSEDFYREAFDVYSYQYLIKPIDAGEAADVLVKAIKSLEQDREKTLEISYKGKSSSLRYSEILYISSMNHNLHYHMRGGSEYISCGKLDELAARIKSDVFVRCHKSFLINLAFVKELTADGFCIGDELVPISRTYSAAARESYRRRLFGIFQEN